MTYHDISLLESLKLINLFKEKGQVNINANLLPERIREVKALEGGGGRGKQPEVNTLLMSNLLVTEVKHCQKSKSIKHNRKSHPATQP